MVIESTTSRRLVGKSPEKIRRVATGKISRPWVKPDPTRYRPGPIKFYPTRLGFFKVYLHWIWDYIETSPEFKQNSSCGALFSGKFLSLFHLFSSPLLSLHLLFFFFYFYLARLRWLDIYTHCCAYILWLFLVVYVAGSGTRHVSFTFKN